MKTKNVPGLLGAARCASDALLHYVNRNEWPEGVCAADVHTVLDDAIQKAGGQTMPGAAPDADPDQAWDLLGELVSAVRDLKWFGGDGGTDAEGAMMSALTRAEEAINGDAEATPDLAPMGPVPPGFLTLAQLKPGVEYVPYGPDLEEVQGTSEEVLGAAGVIFVTLEKDGSLAYEYGGGTEMFWDTSETRKEAGENLWLTQDGNDVRQSRLLFKPREA